MFPRKKNNQKTEDNHHQTCSFNLTNQHSMLAANCSITSSHCGGFMLHLSEQMSRQPLLPEHPSDFFGVLN